MPLAGYRTLRTRPSCSPGRCPWPSSFLDFLWVFWSQSPCTLRLDSWVLAFKLKSATLARVLPYELLLPIFRRSSLLLLTSSPLSFFVFVLFSSLRRKKQRIEHSPTPVPQGLGCVFSPSRDSDGRGLAWSNAGFRLPISNMHLLIRVRSGWSLTSKTFLLRQRKLTIAFNQPIKEKLSNRTAKILGAASNPWLLHLNFYL